MQISCHVYYYLLDKHILFNELRISCVNSTYVPFCVGIILAREKVGTVLAGANLMPSEGGGGVGVLCDVLNITTTSENIYDLTQS
jgi:hypothetical protein